MFSWNKYDSHVIYFARKLTQQWQFARTHPFDLWTKRNSKKVLKIQKSYKTVKSLSIRKALLYASSVAIDISQILDNEQFIASEKLKDQSWLQKMVHIDNIMSWSKYHWENTPKFFIKRNKYCSSHYFQPVHTLSTQHHCMKIIKQAIVYLNPVHTPVDVWDQPVFELKKIIQ